MSVNFKHVQPALSRPPEKAAAAQPAQEVLDGHRAVTRQVRAWDRAQMVLLKDSRLYIPLDLLDQEGWIG